MAGRGANLLITRREFAAMHPGREEYDTDMFYVGIANNILKTVNKVLSNDDIDVTRQRHIALTIAGYVEDIVAGNGVFEAFMSLCEKKYGRTLPFYDTDNDPTFDVRSMPSISALRFLIWYALNDLDEGRLINPMNEGIEILASMAGIEIMSKMLDAPDTPMRPVLMPEKDCGTPVIFQVREMCWWLLSCCYLTRCHEDVLEDAQYDLEEWFNDNPLFNDTIADDQMVYGAYSYLPFNVKCGPLALYPYEWLAAIIKGNPEPCEKKFIKDLDGIECRPYQLYKYKRVNTKSATLLTQDGDEIKQTSSSYVGEVFPSNIKKDDSGYMMMLKWGDEWYQLGISVSSLSGEAFDKIYEHLAKKKMEDKLRFTHYIKLTNGKRIGTNESIEDTNKLFGFDKLPTTQDNHLDLEHFADAKNILWYLDDRGDIDLVPDVAHLVKFKGNKLYDKEEATHDGPMILFERSMMSDEARKYIIDNNLIPDAAMISAISPREGHKLLQTNIRFFYDYTLRGDLRLG